MLRRLYILFSFIIFSSTAALAANPFDGGWQLEAESSTIGFLSVKKGTIAEYSEFATFSGVITPEGQAEIVVALDSVDTKVDLRNVRMRFLFFETFKHKDARVTAVIPPAQIADLAQLHRKTIDLSVTLSLHGVDANVTAPITLTLLDDNTVNVSTVQPIILSLADFDLLEGLSKLEEAASVTITPVGIVSLDLTYKRAGSGGAAPVVAQVQTGGAAALETTGTFSREECVGRFEILSQSRSLNFPANKAIVTEDAKGFLDVLSDVVNRCPDLKIEVGGHTDAWGKADWNQELSRQRAVAVASYLIDKGANPARLIAIGYGETAPLVDNDTAANRAKNRRIEFKVLN
ncbi:OmpA family protein [Phaeobacter sp. HF9A]|uniref:OmpA family protein n=1 Tax=Phaeobacter sp. HF9A TaxID=2721561 RepID=UPI0014318095|nr:OmpA family protein [Phaeobacter sp. HF9A]NIZ13170.1 OmpA family protein [Phaeobacter sp. HF9A]